MKKRDLARGTKVFLFLSLIIILNFCGCLSGYYFFCESRSISVGDPLWPGDVLPEAVWQSLSVRVYCEQKGMLNSVRGRVIAISLPSDKPPVAVRPGRLRVEMKLFGIIPLRQIVYNVMPPVYLIPGGHSIGVLLHSQGVVVVSGANVRRPDGSVCNPARDAGIVPGDIIRKLNGKPVQSENQMRDEIARVGEEAGTVVLEVKRGKRLFKVRVRPVKCSETDRYRIGLFIRDSAAGVGTLTFYDPADKSYGALGHLIADVETSRKADLSDGCIMGAVIQGICPGQRGRPGEKIGMLTSFTEMKGDIRKNTPYGIFGVMKNPIGNPLYRNPLQVASESQIKEGEAEMLTVLEGNRIEKYQVMIEKIDLHARRGGKSLTIKVTDKNLLEEAGGIVQGMSGSPVIQRGKIVGAVTHVLVNDPSRGYAVPVEWMLREAGMVPDKQFGDVLGL